MFYGAAGVGKTSFVHNFSDGVFFISTDRGTRFLPIAKDCRHEVDDWQGVQTALKLLSQNPKKFTMVCFDHIDDIAFFAEEDICHKYDIESADELAHGKYWRDLKNYWKGLIHAVKATGLGIVFICHEETKQIKIRGRQINKTMPLIGKTTWKVILPLVDLLGHCYMEYDLKQKKDVHVLQTQPSDSVEAKDRTTRKKPNEGYELLDSKMFSQTFMTGVRSHG